MGKIIRLFRRWDEGHNDSVPLMITFRQADPLKNFSFARRTWMFNELNIDIFGFKVLCLML